MKTKLVLLLFLLLFCFVSCKSNYEDSKKLYYAALEEYSKKNLSEALSLLSMAKKVGKNTAQIDFLSAKIYFFQNNYDKCNKVLTNTIKHNPDFTEARIWKIRCDIVSENYETAREELSKELSRNMTDWRVFYLYSLLAQKTGKIDEQLIMLNNAEMSLQDASKVFSSAAMTWSLLGMEEKEAMYLEKAKILENIK